MILSALLLAALLLGPALVSRRPGGATEPEPQRAATALASARCAADSTVKTGRADSAGMHYERYFPGRQAM